MADFNLSKGRSGQSSDSIKIEWRALDFAGESGGYVPPSGVCDFEYPANESYVSASTPLGAVALLSGDPVNVRISASTPLGVSAVRLGEPNKAYSAAGSPLGNGLAVVFHDWSGSIPADAQINYVCDVETDSGTLRIPISSWQATLQVDRSNFVQAVVPNCVPYEDDLESHSGQQLVIKRKSTLRTGAAIEQEIARSEIKSLSFDAGPTNNTCTISGHEATFSADDAVSETARVLADVRSISNQNGSIRVRCGIDWFLRPGQLAVAGQTEFTASYINYYVNAADAYMDAGSRVSA